MCIVKVVQQERWGTDALYIEMKNKIVVAHDSNVEYIGKYISSNVAGYHENDPVKIKVSINNEFIIKVDVEVAGNQLNSGTVRRDGM